MKVCDSLVSSYLIHIFSVFLVSRVGQKGIFAPSSLAAGEFCSGHKQRKVSILTYILQLRIQNINSNQTQLSEWPKILVSFLRGF